MYVSSEHRIEPTFVTMIKGTFKVALLAVSSLL